jgi:hypothetical protein
MAGTITTSTIQNDTSSPPTFRNNSVEIGRLCRAWVNYGGDTQTIKGSFNVSSVTYVGTGVYTVNFATPMPDANYSCALSARTVSSSNITGVVAEVAGAYGTAVRTTSALGIIVMDSTSAAVNSSSVSVAIFSS